MQKLVNFNEAEKAEIKKYALAAGILEIVLYLFYWLLGFDRIWEWHSLRAGLTCFLAILATQVLTRRGIWEREWWVTWPVFIMYTTVFPVIIITGTSGAWDVDFDAAKRYLMIASMSACGLAILIHWGSRKRAARPLLALLILAVTAWFSLAGFFYLGYFKVFHAPFAAEDMLPVVQTYWREAVGFIQTQLGTGTFALLVGFFLLYLALVGFLLWKGWGRKEGSVWSWKYLWLFQLVVLAGTVYSLSYWMPRSFPVKEYLKARSYITSVREAEKDHKFTLHDMKLVNGRDKALPSQLPGTVILVIGESEASSHMKAFNPDYPAETTPWLSEMKNTPDFVLLNHAYTNFPQTTQALGMALTSVNQYNNRPMEKALNLIDVARAAGYDTWWISNHSKMGNGDTPIVFVAGLSNHELWTDPPMEDDRHLMPLLEQVPAGGSHFIIINIMGSHIRYNERIPAGFQGIHIDGHSEKENDYDSTVLYTDQMLKEIFDYAREHLNLQALVYMSDHGEDMTYSHGAGKFTFEMARIPMFVYLSPSYQEKFSAQSLALKNHQGDVFTNDLIFDTLSGLMLAPTNQYEARYDLFSSAYHLPPEAALTKHGQIKISTDDYLKGNSNKGESE
jgi:heptose-I-phosphate ethanolaminephosphotransferase